jgi:hypothetical protein
LAPANTADSRWRNHADFFQSREATVAFLTRKWNRELDYRLVKELWAFHDDRIAVQFAYECMRRQWPWVPQLRQRELGIRCGRRNAPARRQHQRSANRGGRPKVFCGRAAAGPTIIRR